MGYHDLRRRFPWNETVRCTHVYRDRFRGEMFYVRSVGPTVAVEYTDGTTSNVRREWFEKAVWSGVITHPARCPECPATEQ